MSQTETIKAVEAVEANPLTPRGHNRLPRSVSEDSQERFGWWV